MADDPAHREEERCFLDDMPAVLGPGAMTALAGIAETLGLDYAGIDFALTRDGSVLVFEANATMVINPPEPEPIWNYRRRAVADVLNAAKSLLVRRACGSIASTGGDGQFQAQGTHAIEDRRQLGMPGFR
jgi:hypothetical protein